MPHLNATRHTLLQAAHNEIYHRGYQAASLSKILKNTGLTKGALYHHFPDKRALGLAVIKEVIYPYFNDAIFINLENSATPIDTLVILLERSAANFSQEKAILGCPLNNLMQEMSPLDEEFRQALSCILLRWQTVIKEGLQRASAEGQIKQINDVDDVALFIVSSWEGALGIAKNLQSVPAYRRCLMQLKNYVQSLKN